MRIFVPILVGFVGISMNAHSGGISYTTSIAFDNGLTDQLDRLNVGYVYERLSKANGFKDDSFWNRCDAAGVFGLSARCSSNASSYDPEADVSGGNGWSELELNLGDNFGIQGESGSVEAKSSGRGSDASSLSGSFQIGFSDDMVNEILAGSDQGIRLGYGFSWIGFGMLDGFNGIVGQWASMPIVGVDQLPADLLIRSSLRTRVTAYSSNYSLQPLEKPKVIFDETLAGDSGVGMVFSPDASSYGFTQGNIVSFRLDVEQRLWTERSVVKVPEPHSIGLLLASLMGLGVVRVFSKKTKDY
jgi:hypothetical protein